MKKILALLLCCIVMATFSSCKKDDKLLEGEEVLFDITSTDTKASSDDSLTSDETSSNEESSENNSSAQSSGEDNTSSQQPQEDKIDTGMNLVDSGVSYIPDINEKYKYASEIYKDLINSTFSYDEDLGAFEIKRDDSVGYYWRVNDDRFDSVAELEAYLDFYFTDECQKTFYDPLKFIDHDGHLYAVVGIVAQDPTYAGCSFKLTKQTNMRIFFECTAYHYKSFEEIDTSKPHFTTAPKDTSIYNTRTVSFVLQITEDGTNWQFTQFGLV